MIFRKISSVVVFIIFIVSITFFTGCNKSTTTNDSAGEQQINMQFDKADLYGEIKEINGGKITLALMEQQEMGNRDMRNRNGEDNGDGENKTENSPQVSENSNDKNIPMEIERNYTGEEIEITIDENLAITSFGGMSQRGGMPEGRPPENTDENNQKNNSEENQQANDENINKEPPDNTEMGDRNFQEEELSIEDLEVGQIIQVWYKEGSDSELERISVMQMPNVDNNNSSDEKEQV